MNKKKKHRLKIELKGIIEEDKIKNIIKDYNQKIEFIESITVIIDAQFKREIDATIMLLIIYEWCENGEKINVILKLDNAELANQIIIETFEETEKLEKENELQFNEAFKMALHKNFNLMNKHRVENVELSTEWGNEFNDKYGSELELNKETMMSLMELVDNGDSHGDGELFVRSCRTPVVKINRDNEEDNSKAEIISVLIINYSSISLCDKVQEAFPINEKNNNAEELNKNYEKVIKKNDVNKKDFFLINAFQKGVTSRDSKKINSSGTGLYNFIEQMEEDNFRNLECSVYSQNRELVFDKEKIKRNNDKIVYNKEGLLNDNIGKDIIKNRKIHFPGTIFYLSFVTEEKN